VRSGGKSSPASWNSFSGSVRSFSRCNPDRGDGAHRRAASASAPRARSARRERPSRSAPPGGRRSDVALVGQRRLPAVQADSNADGPSASERCASSAAAAASVRARKRRRRRRLACPPRRRRGSRTPVSAHVGVRPTRRVAVAELGQHPRRPFDVVKRKSPCPSEGQRACVQDRADRAQAPGTLL
jgi:hypothetical protein